MTEGITGGELKVTGIGQQDGCGAGFQPDPIDKGKAEVEAIPAGGQAMYWDRPKNWQAYQVDASKLGKNDSQLIGKTKRLAIVGCSDSKGYAPYDDPDIEIWSVNNAYGHIKRYTRWFEIHTIEFKDGHFSRRWSRDFRGLDVDIYLSHLAALDCPVYMQKKWDIIPKSIAYPVDEVIKHFGDDRYFTNTISYQIALAIMEGFKEVQIWGVDMAVDTEYHFQRPSVEYWIGIAKGMGIKIYVPPTADLLKTRFLYAFEEREADSWKQKIMGMQKNMEERKAQAMQKMQVAHDQIQQYVGAIAATKEIDKIWK